MICSSCNEQRAEVHARKSRLMPGVNLAMCAECIKAKMEPRYLIILSGRENGTAFIADYIKYRRYKGKDILAKEIIR